MSIQDLGAIGEMIGGVAVILTLIYLALQIRQTNKTTHRQMYGQAATAISEYWFNLAREPELHDLYRKMLMEPSQLARSDLERGFLVLDAYLSLMESYFLHNRQYHEDLSQQRWRRILAQVFNTPGGEMYWQKRRYAFHDEFADYLSSIVEPGV